MLNQVLEIAQLAGEKILEIYSQKKYDTKIKHDLSPVTQADIVSHEFIVQQLEKLFKYPVVSEESCPDYKIRKNFHTFWCVDPLDGTKDFIAGNDQFTVNIALIRQNKPILGVIYAPALKLAYSAEKGRGAFLNGQAIYNKSKRVKLMAADSVFHSTQETIDFLKAHGIREVKKYGSAIKFGKLAEGKVDVYVRLNGSKEWDTAAGHVIIEESGCKMFELSSKEEIIYNKESVKNKPFLALRKDLENFFYTKAK